MGWAAVHPDEAHHTQVRAIWSNSETHPGPQHSDRLTWTMP